MAYDETVAATLRASLAGRRVVERRMFGGLALMLDGNMVCGAYRDRAIFRVGKANQAAALDLPSVIPMAMGDRAMPGMVEIDAAGFADPALRDRLMRLALDFVASLPVK